MPRYLISFDDGSMDHIRDDDLPEVGEAAHAVVQASKDAGVWIFGAACSGSRRPSSAPMGRSRAARTPRRRR